jgi:uncharacterized delta-60 repeat protein
MLRGVTATRASRQRTRIPHGRRAAFERLEARLALADGDLDASFGVAGRAFSSNLPSSGVADMVLQADGKILVAGLVNNTQPGGPDFVLVRLNANGTPDAGFGVNGVVVNDLLGRGLVDRVYGVAIQADQRIVSVGETRQTGGGDFESVIVRYDSVLGQFDLTAIEDFGPPPGNRDDRATGVVIQSDGRIVVSVNGNGALSDIFRDGFTLARLNTNGTRDPTFGNAGVAYVSFGGNSFSFAQGLAMAPDGSFVVVGQTGSPSRVALARFDANGVIDASFGTNGIVITDLPGANDAATDVLMGPDGRIIVGAATTMTLPPVPIPLQYSVLLRYFADGALDPSFDGDGILSVVEPDGQGGVMGAVGGISDLAIQIDGKLVVTSGSLSGDFLVARFNPNGAPDPTFGANGIVRTDFGTGNDSARAVAIQTDGNIVVAGSVNGSAFAVARYLNDYDEDDDGVIDQVEDGHPNKIVVNGIARGDGNNDGTADYLQANVASLSDAVTGGYATLESPGNTRLHGVRATAIVSPPAQVTMPYGAFELALDGAGVGVASVSLRHASGPAVNTVFALGPTRNDATPHWYDFLLENGVGGDASSNPVTLFLQDGADRGDDDLTANGVIRGTFAPAIDLAASALIWGRVFHDVDANGVNDGATRGEFPLVGWTVFLDENQNYRLDSDPTTGLPVEPVSLTDGFGDYVFSDLDRRTYTVVEAPPPGWTLPPSFTQSVVDVANAPRALTAGDLNADGRDDLVVANLASIEIRLSQPDGSFSPPEFLSVNGFPEAVTLADFDRSGTLDLAAAYDTLGEVEIFFSASDGTFDPDESVRRTVGPTPSRMVAGDLGGDGFADLIVNSAGNSVWLLHNLGGGSFDVQEIAVGDHATGLALGHFNPGTGPGQDDRFDLAVTGASGKIIAVNNIGYVNQFTRELEVGGSLRSLAVGQFNSNVDNHLDLAFIDRDATRVHVLHGDGTGAFSLAPGGGTLVEGEPQELVAADFNRDGRADLAVSNRLTNRVSRLVGLFDGSFLSIPSLDAGEHPSALTTIKFSNDDPMGFAVANLLGGSVSVFTPRPGLARTIRLGDNPIVSGVNFGNYSAYDGAIGGTVWNDLNGNGLRDLGPTGRIEPVLPNWTVYLDGNFNGRIDAGERVTLTDGQGAYDFLNLAPGDYQIRQVVQAEFTATGPMDYWTITLTENEVMTGRDFGNQRPPVPSGVIRGAMWNDEDGDAVRDAGERPLVGWIAFLDTNHNDRFDPTTERSTTTDIDGQYVFADLVALRHYRVAAALPPNWGTSFPVEPRAGISRFPVGDSPVAVASADMNLDGHVDLVVANRGSADVSVLINLGNGTFGPHVDYALNSAPVTLSPVDLNGDGAHDLVLTSAVDVAILINRGDGVLLPSAFYHVNNPQSLLVTHDLNQDSLPDIVVASADDDVVIVLFSRGDRPGEFIRQIFSVGDFPRSIAAGDINGDDSPDLVVLNVDSRTISLLVNDNNGSFLSITPLVAPDRPFSLVAADFNDDQRLDLVVTRNGDVNSGFAGGISPLLGNGDGTFFPATPVHLSGLGYQLIEAPTASDLDGDHDLDLVLLAGSTFSSDPIVVRAINDAAGRFTFVETVVEPDATAVIPAELTTQPSASGLELAVSHSGGVTVIIGEASANYPVYTAPQDIASLDVDGDGDLDLMVANRGSDDVSLLRNDSQGAFTSVLARAHDIFVNPGETVIARDFGHFERIGEIRGTVFNDLDDNGQINSADARLAAWTVFLDHNGNGVLEVDEPTTLTDATGQYAFVGLPPGDYPVTLSLKKRWWPTTAGTIRSGYHFSPYPSAMELSFREFPTAVDLNGDHLHDLVTTNSNHLFVHLNNIDNPGYFLPASSWNVGEGVLPPQIADLNDDGLPDLAIANPGLDTIALLMSDVSRPGQFPPMPEFIPLNRSIDSLVAADFNDDGLLDLATSPGVHVLFNNLDMPGQFATPTSYSGGFSSGHLLALDIDNDGLQDLVATNETYGFSVLRNRPDAPGVFLDGRYTIVGNGDESQSLPTPAHLDNDDLIDLAVTGDNNTVRILQNVGNGYFLSTTASAATTSRLPPEVHDMDGDGVLDLLVESGWRYLQTDVTTLLQYAYDFQRRTASVSGLTPVVADLNNDGHLDIATIPLIHGAFGQTRNQLELHLNQATSPGVFTGQTIFLPGLDAPSHVLAANVNDDDLTDLVAIRGYSIVVLPNDSPEPGSFYERNILPINYDDNAGGLISVDLDDDYRPDLITATQVPPDNSQRPQLSIGLLSSYIRSVTRVVTNGVPTVADFGNQLDSDRDGVADSVESLAPNDGDANDDDTPDAAQPHIASLATADGNWVTLVGPSEIPLVDARAVPNPSPDDAPEQVSFPVGHLSFELKGLEPGGSTTVELILNSEPVITTFYKYGATPDVVSPDGSHPQHWYEFLFDRNMCLVGTDCTGAEIRDDDGDGRTDRILLYFVDGQRGDDDLMPNGVIRDPGAPARTVSTPRVGDINLDGIVNRGDAAVLVQNFGRSLVTDLVDGDVNEDNRVDLADLAILQLNFDKQAVPSAAPVFVRAATTENHRLGGQVLRTRRAAKAVNVRAADFADARDRRLAASRTRLGSAAVDDSLANDPGLRQQVTERRSAKGRFYRLEDQAISSMNGDLARKPRSDATLVQ